MKFARVSLVALAALGLSSAASANVVFDSGGFEGYALGGLDGQFGWVGAGYNAGLAPQVVTGVGEQTIGSQAVRLDVPQRSNSADPAPQAYMELPLADLAALGYSSVTLSMDIYRLSETPENIWWYPLGANPFYGLQWDQGPSVLPHGFSGASAPLVTGRYANVTMTWDFVAGNATATYDGAPVAGITFTPGSVEWKGWAMYLTYENAGTDRGPDTAWVDNFVITGIPEPTTLGLLALGLLLRRR